MGRGVALSIEGHCSFHREETGDHSPWTSALDKQISVGAEEQLRFSEASFERTMVALPWGRWGYMAFNFPTKEHHLNVEENWCS